MRETLLFVQLALAVTVIVSILFQTPKGAGLGAISGGAHLFHVRKRKDVVLEKIALVSAISFGLLSLVLTILGV